MNTSFFFKLFAVSALCISASSVVAAGSVQDISSEQQLASILKNNAKVVVDFWSQSCPPCRKLLPNIQAVATKRNDVVIVKINVSSNSMLAQKYGVTAIPTLLFFKNGSQVGRTTGYMTESELNTTIDRLLK